MQTQTLEDTEQAHQHARTHTCVIANRATDAFYMRKAQPIVQDKDGVAPMDFKEVPANERERVTEIGHIIISI